jgi:uncharacterized protein YndB with AHSA1/START domain/uncharacterized damage-inducible protein DinB
MSEKRNVKQKVVVETTPELAFEALTKASELREWFGDFAYTEVRTGGRYAVHWNQGYHVEGRFTELDAPHRAAITWQGTGEPGETTVKFAVKPADGGVKVMVKHSGFGSGKKWDNTLAEAEKGWTTGLENLKATLETGVDLRIARQPFLGILLGGLDAERAEREGIAVDEGIYINDTLEGTAARAAGLKKGDVIVGLGGADTARPQELTAALRSHQAGDVVDVDLVRGQERETIQLALGSRPAPDAPDTAEGLAEFVAEQYKQTDAELKAAVEGLTEEEAAQKPAEGEWSVKEVLAHLSLGERGFNNFLANMALDGWLDGGPGNPTAIPGRLEAVLSMTPSLQGLLDRFLADEAETVAFLHRLPEETLAHKARFYRMRQVLAFVSLHTRDHTEQIKGIIEAVRGS